MMMMKKEKKKHDDEEGEDDDDVFLQIFKHQEDVDFVSFTIFNIVCVLDCVDTIHAFMELAI